MEKMEKKKAKFKFRFPHVLALLIFLVVLATALTYIVPAGSYDRVLN